MPPFDRFDDASAYYGTLAHELVHWTGHESRLAREFGARFGDARYAREELVAEIGAAFVCGHGATRGVPRALGEAAQGGAAPAAPERVGCDARGRVPRSVPHARSRSERRLRHGTGEGGPRELLGRGSSLDRLGSLELAVVEREEALRLREDRDADQLPQRRTIGGEVPHASERHLVLQISQVQHQSVGDGVLRLGWR
jgi:hypothetical protein